MRKIASLLLAAALLATLASCSVSKPPDEKADEKADDIYIAIVSKGFQHQFWQTVYAGSRAAAADLGVRISFEGPSSETLIDMQIDMVSAALDKKPDALCLAVIDVSRLNDKLKAAKAAGIPVIGFDSDIPNAPEGTVSSTASTNNDAAGELAAVKMFEETSIKKRLSAAAPNSPVTIGVLSQDAISLSIVERTNGFVDKFLELSEGVHPGAVAVTGHHLFAKPAAGPAAVNIKVLIPATTEYTAAQTSASVMLEDTPNLIGVFCSNEGTVTGMLAATNDGEDLDRKSGAYKHVTVVGFDAGISQKQAVKKRYFYGSITQDPYRIGYLAVELAYKAIKGEPIDEIVDTGSKFYNHENIDDPEIAHLVYD